MSRDDHEGNMLRGESNSKNYFDSPFNDQKLEASNSHVVYVDGLSSSPFNLEGLLNKEIKKSIEHFLFALDCCIQELEKQMNVVLDEEMIVSYMGLHTGLLKLRAVFYTARDLFSPNFDQADFIAKNLHIDQSVITRLTKESLCEKYVTFMIFFFEQLISEQIRPLMDSFLLKHKCDPEERNSLVLKCRVLVRMVERFAFNIQFGLHQQPDDVIAKSEAEFQVENQPWIQRVVAAVHSVHRRERSDHEEVQETGQESARLRGSGEQG